MIPPDYHLHTTFSCDAKATMLDMCQSAVSRGYHEIGFTEHYDLNPVDDCYNWLKVDAWHAEIERCREMFKGQLIIRAGVEFSEPHLYPQGVRSLLERLPFDYVIGSLHYVGAELVFAEEYFRRRSSDQAFLDYFNNVEQMTRTGNFDILGHLDVLALTARLIYGAYDPGQYEDTIRPILQNCIQRGILLEINTQGMRKPAHMLVPGQDILGWYIELGGESICLGSDAHLADHLGSHLDVALQAARQAGIQSISCFENRQKQPIPVTDFA